jgi:hypothetical protein
MKPIMISIEVRQLKYNHDVIIDGAQSSRLIISKHRTRGVIRNQSISMAGEKWNE